MDRRSDKYKEPIDGENKSSRVNKNRLLYDEINSKIGFEEIPTIETSEEINLSSIDMDNLKRSEYQKVKDFKGIIDVEEKNDTSETKEEIKKKNYDINKVLEEAKKNRKADELEGKRNIKDEDVLNNLNKKYLHQKGFTEEDNEELKELIDTITSKTMVDDIKDEEEKELLSELLATTIDIKLESELSEEQIKELAEENVESENELIDTNSFYSKSLELSTQDLVSEEDAVDHEEDNEDTNILGFEDEKTNVPKIIFISLVLLIVVIVVAYFVLQFLGVKFN
jgi:hypothetical protein